MINKILKILSWMIIVLFSLSGFQFLMFPDNFTDPMSALIVVVLFNTMAIMNLINVKNISKLLLSFSLLSLSMFCILINIAEEALSVWFIMLLMLSFSGLSFFHSIKKKAE